MSNPKADVKAATDAIERCIFELEQTHVDPLVAKQKYIYTTAARAQLAALTEQQAETPVWGDSMITWCIAALRRANGGSDYIAGQCDDALIELSGLKLMAQRFAGGSTSKETSAPLGSLPTNAEKGVEYPAAASAPVSSAAPTDGLPQEIINLLIHISRLRPSPVALAVSKDMRIAIQAMLVMKQAETRMPCGHLQADRVSTWVCGNGDHACNLRGYCINPNCDQYSRTPDERKHELSIYAYCRSCKQQAEAVAQARLNEAEWWADGHHGDEHLNCFQCKRISELARAVKEAGR